MNRLLSPSLLSLLASLLLLNGCASMVGERLAGSLGHGIVNQDDPQTVQAGAPAYLLLIDGMIQDDPENGALLQAGGELYGAYASLFVEDAPRAKRMAARARDYSRRAFCLEYAEVCALEKGELATFQAALAQVDDDGVALLYSYGAGWAGWIKSRSGEWDALADLPKVEAVMERVVVLDERHDHGRAHLYLGVMRSQLPPALGGNPERGRVHFEKAIALSDSRDLLAKVEFARNYARLVFDQELHDRLLNEVLAATPEAPGLTLGNVLAQQQAQRLLDSSKDYF
ncbi:MAG TPA: TRAP transporter TatT component family protein [Gammaproteobacteria bacterium]